MKKLIFALLAAGMIFLSGCNFDRNIELDSLDPKKHEVGLYGGQFMAHSTDELKSMVAGECKRTCPDMDYVYRDTKYTVYEEGGMYVARDPKCICYDKE